MKLFRDRDASGIGQGLFGRPPNEADGSDGPPPDAQGEPAEGRRTSRGVSPAEDRIRAYTRDRAARARLSQPAHPGGPPEREAAEAGAHDPGAADFEPGGGQTPPDRPRRIWDIEAGAAAEPERPVQPERSVQPEPSATSAGDRQARVGCAPSPPAEPDPTRPPEDEDMIAYARAQVARMADAGIAEPGGGHASRAKTRMIGFQSRELAGRDPFSQQSGAARRGPDFPVGWLVVTGGPGFGASFALTAGVATLGRGEDQTICLDFGDTAISRSAHASIAYDPETGQFFLGAGGRSNLVRLDERPVLATEPLAHGQRIRIGETSLGFFALCGPEFSWQAQDGGRAESGEEA